MSISDYIQRGKFLLVVSPVQESKNVTVGDTETLNSLTLLTCSYFFVQTA